MTLRVQDFPVNAHNTSYPMPAISRFSSKSTTDQSSTEVYDVIFVGGIGALKLEL